jgi:hypothetical protein
MPSTFTSTRFAQFAIRIAEISAKFFRGLSVKFKANTEKTIIGVFKDNKLAITITIDYTPEDDEVIFVDEQPK